MMRTPHIISICTILLLLPMTGHAQGFPTIDRFGKRHQDYLPSIQGDARGIAGRSSLLKSLRVEYGSGSASPLAENSAVFSSWQWVNPFPSAVHFRGVQMLDSNTFVAVGEGSVFLKSTDAGIHWLVRSNVGGTDLILRSPSFSDPAHGTVVGFSNGGSYGGIVRTDDGGDTWIPQGGDSLPALTGVSFTSRDTGTVVGFYGTILHTTNGGISWIKQNSGTTDRLWGVSFTHPDTGTAVGETNTILRTTNGGATWFAQTNHPFGVFWAVSFTDPRTGTVASSTRIYRTTDGGATWFQPALAGGSSPPGCISYAYGLKGVSFADANHGTWIWDLGVIVHTTDGGATRDVQCLPTPYPYLYGVSFSIPSTGMVAGLYDVLYRTTDGGTSWNSLIKGPTMDLKAIAFPDINTGYAVGASIPEFGSPAASIIRTTNAGLSWSIHSFDSSFIPGGVAFTSADTGTVVGTVGTILRTTNAGTTWTQQLRDSRHPFYAVSFPDGSHGTAVGSGILHTTNGGSNWVQQYGGQVDSTFLSDTARFFGVSFTDVNTGTAVGYHTAGGVILRTTNGGATWIPQFNQPGVTLYGVSFADANNGTAVGNRPSSIWGYYGVILHTTNGGSTWTSQYNGFASFSCVSFSDPNTGVVSGYLTDSLGDSYVPAVLQTTDGGAHWTFGTTAGVSLSAVAMARSGSKRVAFVAGQGGAVLCSALSPLSAKTWTGLVDSSWNNDSNWSPMGAPLKPDSVIIPPASINPVIYQIQDIIVISSLNIVTGGHLTITSNLSRLTVKGDVRIDGRLEVRPPAATSIVVGGSWLLPPGSALLRKTAKTSGEFDPSHSTVSLRGQGLFSSGFYNLALDSGSAMQSNGNVHVQNQCSVLGDVTISPAETLFVDNSGFQSLNGSGSVLRGTIRRALDSASLNLYRFESDSTYVRFNGNGTYPAKLTMTAFPDTAVQTLSGVWRILPSRVNLSANTVASDSVTHFTKWAIGVPRPHSQLNVGFDVGGDGMVDRLYEITTDGGSNWQTRLALHYSQSELPPGILEDSLKMMTLDTTLESVTVSAGANGAVSPSGFVIVQRDSDQTFAITPVSKYRIDSVLTDGLNQGAPASYTIHHATVNHTIAAYFSLAEIDAQVKTGWNMVSVPMTVGDYRKVSLFPGASSRAFRFAGSYLATDTLQNSRGYWVKYPNPASVPIIGYEITRETVSVADKWNMIGVPSYDARVAEIEFLPGVSRASNFYGYAGGTGYYIEDTLKPGVAYWVKVNGTGRIVLHTSHEQGFTRQQSPRQPGHGSSLFSIPEGVESQSLVITDALGRERALKFSCRAENINLDRFELPPPPVEDMDVRYGSNRWFEMGDANRQKSIPVKVSGAEYPVRIEWKFVNDERATLTVGGRELSIGGNGSTVVSDPSREIVLGFEPAVGVELPTSYELFQNHPNPFNPVTEIRYQLPVESKVTIRIYDPLGRQIALLADEVEGAGQKSVEWNGGDVASGIYFYRLEATSTTDPAKHFTGVKKMVLLK